MLTFSTCMIIPVLLLFKCRFWRSRSDLPSSRASTFSTGLSPAHELICNHVPTMIWIVQHIYEFCSSCTTAKNILACHKNILRESTSHERRVMGFKGRVVYYADQHVYIFLWWLFFLFYFFIFFYLLSPYWRSLLTLKGNNRSPNSEIFCKEPDNLLGEKIPRETNVQLPLIIPLTCFYLKGD